MADLHTLARLARSFERDGLKTAALHGDKSQDERLKALDAFKRGEVEVMVATDVAARGIDIADLPAVFNFDVPFNAEDYVHRIGRTGRAGASGVAVSFISAGTHDHFRLIEKRHRLSLAREQIPGFEPVERLSGFFQRRVVDVAFLAAGTTNQNRADAFGNRCIHVDDQLNFLPVVSKRTGRVLRVAFTALVEVAVV